jgi:hypothetical protein
MADKTYTIVPDYDTVIVLRDPLVDFAVWDPPEDDPLSPDSSNTCAASSLRLVPNESTVDRVLRLQTQIQPLKNICLLSAQSTGAEPTTAAAHTTNPPPGPQAMESNTEKVSTSSPPKEIHYFVSSTHLRTASKYFARALSGNWAEGHRDSSGHYRIVVESWDEVALLRLLNVFHLKSYQVPPSINLELLAKIAVLVDYYDCSEAVALWGRVWLWWADLKEPVENRYDRRLVLWICVAVVFRQPRIFAQATSIAIYKADEDLRTLGLPIPEKVVSKLY